MPTMVEVICDGCEEPVLKSLGEVTRARKLGRRMFCTRSCTAKTANLVRKSQEIVVTCPCGKKVKTTTHNKAKRHCDRSCASKYSMTEERQRAQRESGKRTKNLISVAETLKRREGWKYSALKEALGDRDFEFEFELKGRVFDLALLDEKILVEFDGPDHDMSVQAEDDADKDWVAEVAGFMVVRRSVIPSTVISPETIKGL